MSLSGLIPLIFYIDDPFLEKTGHCPKVIQPEGGECPALPVKEHCVTDDECPGTQKCCSPDGCTLKCVAAVGLYVSLNMFHIS